MRRSMWTLYVNVNLKNRQYQLLYVGTIEYGRAFFCIYSAGLEYLVLVQYVLIFKRLQN